MHESKETSALPSLKSSKKRKRVKIRKKPDIFDARKDITANSTNTILVPVMRTPFSNFSSSRGLN